MCLAVPGEVLELLDAEKALVKFGQNKIEISLAFVDDVTIGDYVVAHSGFALTKLDQAEADEQLKLWDEYLAQDNDEPDAIL